MKNCLLKFLILAGLCLTGLMIPTSARADGSNVLFIFDASGSMKKKVDNTTRIEAAKQAMADALKDMPADVRLGLVLYGHRKAKDCSDIELVSPIGADDATKISGIISNVKVKGETPIAESLKFATRSFAALKGQSNSIVLVTDGIEECGGDPCAAAKAVHDAGLDLKVNIVGFTLNDAQRKAVQCIADETGGTYYDARNAKALTTALNEVKQQVVVPPLPNPAVFNLVNAANGGTLVAAPVREWQALISNPEPYDKPNYAFYTHDVPSEAIFAFKDHAQAVFSRFDYYVPEASDANLKEFELSASDTLLGDYKSLGKFTTQNTRLLDSPYQSFTFPEITARYLKLRVLSTHGGGTPMYLFPIRVVGKLVEGSADAAPAYGPSAGQINVISSANGGSLIAAPMREWAGAIAQAEDFTGPNYITYTHQIPNAAIFAFKDQAQAEFDKFAVLIAKTSGSNVKEFELSVADDLASDFKSLGAFSTLDLLLTNSPYQEFALPVTKARYLKVTLLSSHRGQSPLDIPAIKLFGKIIDGTAQAPKLVGPGPGQINLISMANGGKMVSASMPEWAGVIAQAEDFIAPGYITYTHQLPSEAVISFKDGKSATFDKFSYLIAESTGANVKEFELLAGDSVDGNFQSLGTFTTQNLFLPGAPYQEFSFPAVTAKYLKVRLLTAHSGQTPLNIEPMKLWGTLN